MTVIGHGYDDNVGAPAFRNVIINGNMSVAQRNTSVAGITGTGYFTADRWNAAINALGTWTNSVENDAPIGSGLSKSWKWLCTTADTSPASGDYCVMEQRIEGQNLQHFCKGTTSTKQLVLQFWVKANVTGTYIVEIRDETNGRHICKAYTISASGVWEKKTLVFSGDTVGALANDNTMTFNVEWWFSSGSSFSSGTLDTSWATSTNANRAVGQVNLASAVNNYWQITGVQLEAGSVATPFEFESFETTLRKCQRYFYSSYEIGTAPGSSATSSTIIWNTSGANYPKATIYLPVKMRTAPTTITCYRGNGTSGAWDYWDNGVSGATTMGNLYGTSTILNVESQSAAFNARSNISGHITASAEL